MTATQTTGTTYQRFSDAAEMLHALLRNATQPDDRARVLYGLSAVEDALAILHRRTYGPDPLPDEPGRDLADALAFSAYLLGRIADAEQAIANRRPLAAGRHHLDVAVNPILDRMITAGHMDEQLRDQLYNAVEPLVGGQAAETIACLPLADQSTSRKGN